MGVLFKEGAAAGLINCNLLNSIGSLYGFLCFSKNFGIICIEWFYQFSFKQTLYTPKNAFHSIIPEIFVVFSVMIEPIG